MHSHENERSLNQDQSKELHISHDDHDHEHTHEGADNHEHEHHGHEEHGHGHGHGHGDEGAGGCPFAHMFKNLDQDANAQAMFGVNSPHGKRELPSANSENIHVNLVMTILRVTRAEVLMEVFNDLIKPLPHTAQALCSTLFISIVPIFIIYLLNLVFLSRPSIR